MLASGIPVLFTVKGELFGGVFENMAQVQLFLYDEIGYGMERLEKELAATMTAGQCQESYDKAASEQQIRAALTEIKGLAIAMP